MQSSGYLKYPTLSKLMDNISTISHNNTGAEYDFNTNGNLLTGERTL